ncbi:unnamed protein product [Caenorhabditis bovis]|uniref:Uncharacterized protein n=1 Tax=Caenorhabditis bovis TaxID=2654633 RepID=A0A8S1EQ46_9PELO|nr:unnamed protein product [Caenorhabditis bovis]
MDFKVRTKGLWVSGKNYIVGNAASLANGVKFEDMFNVYAYYGKLIVPTAIEYSVDCIVAFFLFHIYLFYVLVITLGRAVVKRFKLKGSQVVPEIGAFKQKAGLILTYFFVCQSISRWTLGASFLDKVMGWVFQVKPQINFKPQIKIAKSESNSSLVSMKSKFDTSINCGFESEDEDTRKAIKNLSIASNGLDFVSDFTAAVAGTHKQKKAKSAASLASMEQLDESFESEADVSLPLEEETSMSLVEKWLAGQNSSETKSVNDYLLKLVAQDVIRRVFDYEIR